MKGQVRGLALELLRQDCVDCLEVSDNFDGFDVSPAHLQALAESDKACTAYNQALHGVPYGVQKGS